MDDLPFPARDANETHRETLRRIARSTMHEHGLFPEFSNEVLQESEHWREISSEASSRRRDLRLLPWCSIDNDDTRDLDQLTAAEVSQVGENLLRVAIADVDIYVGIGSAMDRHAAENTTSVYTAAEVFPMLPNEVSQGRSSLHLNEDRYALVVEMRVSAEGVVVDSEIFEALVRNHAKLDYNEVSRWLDNGEEPPPAIAGIPGLAENLRLQDQIAFSLRSQRVERGALELETLETKPVFVGDKTASLQDFGGNRARRLIEDAMLATNGAVATYLHQQGISALRRVVRAPKRWERIVEIAAQYHFVLPMLPNAKALASFLKKQKSERSEIFPDISLAIVKLLGKGEYAVDVPGQENVGHFALALRDYSHATAPNRRFADLVAQRLLKAALHSIPPPYLAEELTILAKHLTAREDDVAKVERRVKKSAAALVLAARVGEVFDALCTGASSKGSWVRILRPHVEGKLVGPCVGIDVGHKLRVRLILADVERGFLDFECMNGES